MIQSSTMVLHRLLYQVIFDLANYLGKNRFRQVHILFKPNLRQSIKHKKLSSEIRVSYPSIQVDTSVVVLFVLCLGV